MSYQLRQLFRPLMSLDVDYDREVGLDWNCLLDYDYGIFWGVV